MGISHFPMPSFTLVLTSERVIVPGRSTVIRFDTPETKPLHLPRTDFMKTIDLRDEHVDERQFSFNAGNESGTVLGHDNSDACTVFEEMRPDTSRGTQTKEDSNRTTGRLERLLIQVRMLFPTKSNRFPVL